MKNRNFINGAVVLGAAGIMIKILGALFKIPLGNMIKSEGMGYYSTSYPLYVALLVILTAGFPTGISKLVSEEAAKGNYSNVKKIFAISVKLLLGVGALVSGMLYWNADFIVSDIFKNPNALMSLKAIAPALFFVSLMSAFKGYYQGLEEMKPTAMSQIVEQLFRVGLGLLLAVMLRDNKIMAAAGASFGTTLGAFFGASFMTALYFSRRKKCQLDSYRSIDSNLSFVEVSVRLIRIAIPITVGAGILPIMNLIDTTMVIRRLQEVGYVYEDANRLYGQLTGMAATLVNFPQVLTMAIAMSIVPLISRCYTVGEHEEAVKNTKLALKITMMISLPATFGLVALSTPIMKMLFPKEPQSIGQILFFLGMGVVFLCTIQAITGIFQGMGKPYVPVKNLAIGCLVKVGLTYSLLGMELLNVKGAAIASVAAYVVAFVLNIADLQKYMDIKLEISKIAIKPLAASACMGACVYFAHAGLVGMIGNTKATIVCALLGVLVYSVMVLKLGVLGEDEILSLPKGEKLLKKMKRL